MAMNCVRPIALIFTSLLFAVGCQSVPADRPPPLPFHVSVGLMGVTKTPSPAVDDPAGLRADLAPQAVLDSLEENLDRVAFARATALPLPELELLEQWSRERKESHYLKAATKEQADFLLLAALEYDPEITHHINEKFWLNLPLFLLGGPFCYLVDDQSYETTATLTVRLYDLTFDLEAVETGEVLDESVEVGFAGTQLDFIDRAGSNVTSYALSLLIPAGLLATESELTGERIEQATLAFLGEDLAKKLLFEEGKRIISNRRLASFSIDPARSTVARATANSVSFDVSIKNLVSNRGLDYSIWGKGMAPVNGSFGRGEQDSVHTINKTLTIPAEAAFVHLRVKDSRGQARKYTFAVAADRGGDR